MASPKMLEQRKADIERELCVFGHPNKARLLRRKMHEEGRVVRELVNAANSGDEGATTLLTEMRKELVKQHTEHIK